MTAVVGLDLSLTSTGIAWVGRAHPMRWFTKRVNAQKLTRTDRLLALRARVLVELMFGPDVIVIEDTVARSQAASALGELHGVIKVAIADGGHPAPYLVAPATVKTFACGKGNAPKVDVVIAARDRLGYTGSDDNEADALWLLAIGCELAGRPIVTLPKSHMRALDKVKAP